MALRFSYSRKFTSFRLPLASRAIFSSSSEPPETSIPAEAPHSHKPFLPSFQPSTDADMVSQVLIHHYNPFHPMESSLQLNGINLSRTLVHQTLLRLKHVSKIAFAFFSWAKETNYAHDSTSYNLMIDIMAKVRQFDVAWQLIVEMDQNQVKPTSTTFSVLIRRLVSAGLTRNALRVFDDMSCFLDGEYCNDDFYYMFDTLCKYGYPKVATEVFNKWKSWRFQPDAKMYTILISGWCKVNKHKMAERFFKEMVAAGIQPNLVTYNVVLNGICRKSSLHPDGRFERTVRDAEKLFDEMRERGIDPDVTSYSIVLHVYSRAHKPSESLEMFRMMKDKGFSPTVASYTSVVKCLCSCGRLEDAESLLEEMVRDGVNPSAGTFNCFFKEYRGRKDVDSALRLYHKMKNDSLCLPSIHTYNIMLGMFTKLSRMELVKEVWDDMKASGAGGDLDSYTLLIHGLCEKQKWREACEYFVEMIEKGILPQKVTFETLYRGLIQADMLRTWWRLKKRLEEESISFGSEFQIYHLNPYKR